MPHRKPARVLLCVLLLSCSDSGEGSPASSPLEWGDAAQWAEAPAGATSWEWILITEALPNPPPAVDYLGIDGLEASAAYVEAAQAGGAQVWCYISVGTAEDWRADYADFLAVDAAEREAGREGVVGEIYPEWPDERWLNPRQEALLPLIEARLDHCADLGFDMVEFDNMDGYDNETGFEISEEDEITYLTALAQAARDRGLAPIHKGASGLAEALEPHFDAILLEDCLLYDFCQDAQPYVEAGKPVWDVEYPEAYADAGRALDLDAVCNRSAALSVSTLIKRLDLNTDTIVCEAR
ncbi:endo alpha-1,4 polygalactosaminidase [Myxococcota bacterium]|nr:endo alpha-1,4 polygalactosaminidase [Myxococcota bacterium]